jgi:hypothetical protein
MMLFALRFWIDWRICVMMVLLGETSWFVIAVVLSSAIDARDGVAGRLM